MTSTDAKDDTRKSETATTQSARRTRQEQGSRQTQQLDSMPESRDSGDSTGHAHVSSEKVKLVLQVIMTAATVGAFVAAAIYANYARQQLAEMRNADRPWIGVLETNVTKPLAHGQPIEVVIHSQNTGQSPALHMFSRFDINVRITKTRNDAVPTIAGCQEPKMIWDDEMGGSILLPGSSGLAALTSDVHLTGPRLSDKDVDFLNQVTSDATPSPSPLALPPSPGVIIPTPRAEFSYFEKAGPTDVVGLYITGCLDYFDSYRRPHRTNICQFYTPQKFVPDHPNGAFSNCSKGNSAD